MAADDDATTAVLFASRALVGVAVRSLSSVEVTLPQYRALVLLASRGAQNVGSLADLLDVHPSTATRLCDRLEANGLIERSPSVESRREVTLELTASGHALVRQVGARRRKEIGRIVARLDPADRRALVEAFGAFARAAGEAPDDAWKLGWTT